MPKIIPRPNAFRGGPVAPGAGAAVGAGIEGVGELLSQISAQQTRQEIQDIKITGANRAKADAARERQKNRADQVKVSQIKIANRVRFNEIRNRVSQVQDPDKLDEAVTQAQSEIDTILEESLSQFDFEGGQRFTIASEDSFGTARINAINAGTVRGVQLMQEGAIGAQRDLLQSITSDTTQDEALDAIAEAQEARTSYIGAGMNEERFVRPLVDGTIKGIADEFMFESLKGQPLQQLAFLNTLEANKETRKIFGGREITEMKKAIQSEVDAQRRFKANIEIYDAVASSGSIQTVRTELGTGNIEYDEAVRRIINSGASKEAVKAGLFTIEQENSLKHTVFEEETAAERAELSLQGDIANDTLTQMGRDMRDLAKALGKDDAQSSTALEETRADYAAILLDNRRALGERRFNAHALMMFYGRKDRIRQEASDEPWNRWYPGTQQGRSPYSKLIDTMAELDPTPENAFKLEFISSQINTLEGGSAFLADSPEEAQQIADDINRRADIAFGTQELQLGTEAATERAEVNASIPSPKARSIDPDLRAKFKAEIVESAATVEEALLVNARIDPSMQFEEGEIREAFTFKAELPPIEEDLALTPEIVEEQPRIDIRLDTGAIEPIAEQIPDEQLDPVLQKAVEKAEKADERERFIRVAGESPGDFKARGQREVVKEFGATLVKGVFVDPITAAGDIVGPVFDSIDEASNSVEAFILRSMSKIPGKIKDAALAFKTFAETSGAPEVTPEDLGFEIKKVGGKFVPVPIGAK